MGVYVKDAGPGPTPHSTKGTHPACARLLPHHIAVVGPIPNPRPIEDGQC